ncbi:hypothetical protein VFPPC_05027 [Pochonia chlamydosporia 170]|uniref:Uncharacterized protein n=1 Tax=Pochonia chlamydosporia 170 TaxID=1380566 RepID=A0A179FT81_METCM|nr:hypothetical protein VFPPC_05027 [Pochonia chlamydosporia 170]OAQ68846.2 hypothetical protein VFPPC_05027 [Pochonia chlamydosporia 170]
MREEEIKLRGQQISDRLSLPSLSRRFEIYCCQEANVVGRVGRVVLRVGLWVFLSSQRDVALTATSRGYKSRIQVGGGKLHENIKFDMRISGRQGRQLSRQAQKMEGREKERKRSQNFQLDPEPKWTTCKKGAA